MTPATQIEGGARPREGRWLRAAVAAALGSAAAIVAFTTGAGLTGSPRAALAIAVVAAAAVAAAAWRWPLVSADAGTSSAFRLVCGVATVAALVQLARLAVFIVWPGQIAYSQFPTSDWEIRHSCLTAYFVAAEALPTTPNVWDDALYSLPGGDPTALRRPRMMGPFRIDAYEYPPPFLLLPRLLDPLVPDFARFRMVWFGLIVGATLACMIVVARALGTVAATRAVLLIPFVWMGIPLLNTLQKGNVQVLVIAISMAAMVLFERRRLAAGGALLAYATVSKLYPGMLLVYLFLRRGWRAIAWTAALSGALVVLMVLDAGFAPLAAFLKHLPGLLGGEAFPAFRNPAATGINLSVPGLVFKLKLFGVAGTSFAEAKALGWVYTLVVLGLTALAARRTYRDGDAPAVWLGILILATLRSPFLPQGYGAFPGIWLVTLLAATRPMTSRNVLALALAWLALNVYVPMDWGLAPRVLALVSLFPQVAVAAVALVAILRTDEAAAEVGDTEAAAA
jgi:alpha-1,2-mannosyltransferase